MVATTKKKRLTQEQKLIDAVTLAASCLKEAGDPLHGIGPSEHYAVAFDSYGRALRNLILHDCPLHIADWRWDGYEGVFSFYWTFGARLVQPGSKYDHDTRFMEMRCPALYDPSKPIREELARLRAEASHYDEMRATMMRWASEVRDLSLATSVEPTA